MSLDQGETLRLRAIETVLTNYFRGVRAGKAQYVDGKCVTPTIEQAEAAAAGLTAFIENRGTSLV